jgi:hypothetical protein
LAKDPQERLERFVAAAEQIQTSWGRTRGEIAQLAICTLFPTFQELKSHAVASFAPTKVETETAVMLMRQLLKMGVDREGLMQRLASSPSAGDGWRQARHMLETHRTMQEAISKVTSTLEAGTPARPPRRRSL